MAIESLRRLTSDQQIRLLCESALELLKQGITTLEEVATTTMED